MAVDNIYSVYDLIEKIYDAKVSVEDPTTNLSIGTSDLIIAQTNPRRIALVIVNLSSNIVYIKPKAPASSTSGIRLAPSGGSVSMNFTTDLHLPAQEWHAIASGAGSAIYITSVVLR
ncbi:hypothetical protein CMI37_19725 [Candidatus Pacearchaeota archaeon]|nr:hypothetical protein [Candidatus Pacearchaeota archaeon]|tara:strand:- start:344 stop:694 length:351 start_codon:yes stop_codon:yes gene_type:complete